MTLLQSKENKLHPNKKNRYVCQEEFGDDNEID